MPKEKSTLKYNHGEKSMKILFIIYADMDSLLYKIDICQNNPKKSSTAKIYKHATSVYSLFTHCSFDATKDKHNYFKREDCMKNFSRDLRKHNIN